MAEGNTAVLGASDDGQIAARRCALPKLSTRAALLVSILLLPFLAARAEGPASEYDIKAAFLLNFARFVEWPDLAPSSPLRICVLGKDPFGKALDDVVSDRSVNGHPIVVRRLRSIAEAQECQVMFVSSSEASQLARILAGLEKSPVLSVSDIPGFAGKGGVIGFVAAENKIRFDLSLEAATHSRLKISSQLIRVARSIDGARAGEASK